jgi:WD40 repeat protein/3',5'-cyclic AMP phosphodiesterase CpdA
VVNAALGLNLLDQVAPSGIVLVDFPLADATDRRQWRAKVEQWLPPPREGAAGDDIAGLMLLDDPLTLEAEAAKLAVEVPRIGHRVRVFGCPPQRPDGGWVEATIRGRLGNGKIQLDSESALRVERGFSGSPVFDDSTGRVVGLVATAPVIAQERDSYAIGADRLRVAWPEVLSGRWQRTARSARPRQAEVTLLHVSDMRFGSGNEARFPAIRSDLRYLAAEHGLHPDLLIVTGDLTMAGLPSQFKAAGEFLGGLAEAAEIPRRHVAIVPGNHDVNRKACRAYFDDQESQEAEPVSPYFPKWSQFAAAFADFYADAGQVSFTPDEPWTLFTMPELSVVVAGLNSTMADSHRAEDHYGETGDRQLHWFAEQLTQCRSDGWLRIAAVHHAVADDASARLRDAAALDRSLGTAGLVNMLLHGQAANAELHWLGRGLPVLSGEYQLITIRPHGFTQYARQYVAERGSWVGDTRISRSGSEWSDSRAHELTEVAATFPPQSPAVGQTPDAAAAQPGQAGPPGRIWRGEVTSGSRPDEFFERVADATRVRWPRATVTPRVADRYLRVSKPTQTGGVEQLPIGVIDGAPTEADLDAFVVRAHRQFAAADPTVQSELVYSGPAASAHLIALAMRRGIQLRSFIEYQGLVDLRALAEAQAERLSMDRNYPARQYVPQRYRVDTAAGGDVRTGLVEQAITWLGAPGAQLIIVLGDFGRGKTSFLRQLTRTLPAELPGLLPLLVELRTLEKAPTLDELLALHLAKQGVERFDTPQLRYMIRSGRIALLFDGFDELELRVGYDNAADYLQILLESVTERAKVVLTSRTQHFRSTGQVRTALGERLARPTSRVVILEDFSEGQIIQFLTNFYGGDDTRARARFDLLSDIGNLLDLAHNPRMLAFVAAMKTDQLRAVRDDQARFTIAGLYELIINFWLDKEEERQRHPHGLPSLGKKSRLAACTALAQQLWESKDVTIALKDLTAGISDALSGLAEPGYTDAAVSHSIGSGSLLVMTGDGAFAFVHLSIMEWLVAAAAAKEVRDKGQALMLTRRRMSRPMVEFFTDLAGRGRASSWAGAMLADPQGPQAAKQNALAVMQRIGTDGRDAASGPGRQNLAGVDLRSQDLTGRDLREADLRGADLREMRLHGTDLSGADLRDADLRGARLAGGSLRDAKLAGSKWDRAALLGVAGVDELLATPELIAAAVTGRDRANAMSQPPGELTCSAICRDGELLAVGCYCTVQLIDLATKRIVRVLSGHLDKVQGLAFSPDGSLLATAAEDSTARIWDVATGGAVATLTDHVEGVSAVAFSPDGSLLATASHDKTARIWDITGGSRPRTRTLLRGHTDDVRSVAFSPDGSLLATASDDKTVRIWDVAADATLDTVAILDGHTSYVMDVAFSRDGRLLATGSLDGTARIWDIAAGTIFATRTALEGHTASVIRVAFSPDGSLLATASNDNTARIWDLAVGTVRATLPHDAAVNSVTFSPDGTLLVTTAGDHAIRTWDVTGASLRNVVDGQNDFVTGVTFASGGNLLVAVYYSGAVRTWNLADGRSQVIGQGPESESNPLAFSPDGTLLVTASNENTAVARDVDSGTIRTTFTGHSGQVTAAAFSPDGILLATGSADKTVRVWNRDGTIRTTLKGHSDDINGVGFSPNGTLLATVTYDGFRIWDIATSTCKTVVDTYIAAPGNQSLAFSPDGTLLATNSSWRKVVTLWDMRTEVDPERHGLLERFVSAIRSGPKTYQPWANLDGHTATVRCVTFSPDGNRIASGSDDTTARIWDRAGLLLFTLRGHAAPVFSVAFSPDGSLLATASDVVRIWDLSGATGPAVRATLIPFRDGGHAVLTDDGYTLDGEPGDDLWWAIKLCRFAPGELDPYVPEVRRLPPDTGILPPTAQENHD